MHMDKNTLIETVREAFKNVKLEEGIGLWEAQGLDDYADEKTMNELRKKDERNDWRNIPLAQLLRCASSLSFFDAKGMRFHLPSFMLLDIMQDESGINVHDITFTLGYDLKNDYQKERFSLLNNEQIISIVRFLEYKMQLIENRYSELHGASSTSYLLHDVDYSNAFKTLQQWQQKLEG